MTLGRFVLCACLKGILETLIAKVKGVMQENEYLCKLADKLIER